MAKLGGISRPILHMPFYNQIPALKYYISSAALQQHNLRNKYKRYTGNNKIKTFLSTPSPCKLQGCYGISGQNNEEDIENKMYKEVIKEYSFKVPSFGGSVSASSPFNITVSFKR